MTSPATIRLLEAEVDELLASHAGTAAVDYARYRTNPIGFAEEVLRVSTLWKAQRDHLNAVAQSRRVVAYGANGCSKSFDDAILALWWIYAWDGLVIATSAKEMQLRDSFMRDVRRLFQQAPVLPGELYSTMLRRPDRPEAGLLCSAAGASDNLRSYHAPRVMVQLQEAQGLPAFAFESAEMMAVGEEDRVTCTGNSSQPGGELHRRVRSAGWVSVRFNAEEHPNVVTGTVVIPGGPTRASIAQRATDYGIDSGFYIASVKGLFPADSPESLVQQSWLEEAAVRWAGRRLEPGAPWFVGLDPARFGADQTVMAARQEMILWHLVGWEKLNTMQTCGRVKIELDQRGIFAHRRDGTVCTTLVIDATGIGSGVYDRFLELKQYDVREYQSGHFVAPTRGPLFRNRRAASYWGLRMLLETGKIALPPDPKLTEELTATQWLVTSEGRIQIEAKDDIRARLGRSPDRGDATAMAFDGVYRGPAGRFEIGEIDH